MSNIETARLVLHPLTADESERVAAGEPGVDDRWAPGYPTVGDVAAATRFLGICANSSNPQGQPFGNYEIRRRADGLAIGGIGFHGLVDENGSVSIGYGFVPSAQGQGFETEALRGLLQFAQANGVTCVKGSTSHDDIASHHVLTAAGMQQTGQDEHTIYFEITWTDTTADTDPRS